MGTPRGPPMALPPLVWKHEAAGATVVARPVEKTPGGKYNDYLFTNFLGKSCLGENRSSSFSSSGSGSVSSIYV